MIYNSSGLRGTNVPVKSIRLLNLVILALLEMPISKSGIVENLHEQAVLLKLLKAFDECELLYYFQKDPYQRINFENLHTSLSGVFFLHGNFNTTLNRHSDIHKHSACKFSLAIFYFSSNTPLLEKQISTRIFPLYAPILRRDKDHVLIHAADEKLCDRHLSSPHFGMKIRFKLCVYQNKNENFVKLKTVKLYGKPGGKHLVIHLDILNISNYIQLGLTKNFNRKPFRFCIPKISSHLEIRRNSKGQNYFVRGLYHWYLEQSANSFNYTHQIFYTSNGGDTGTRLANGTWVGAVGDLLYGKCDISIMIALVHSRHKFISWSPAFLYEWIIFVTHSPKIYYSPKGMLWVFTPELWMLFFLALVVIAVLLKIISGKEMTKWVTLSYIYATFLEQDQKKVLRNSSVLSRMLVSVWLLFAIIMGTVYKGKLVGVIGFPVYSWTPKTFEQLATSNYRPVLNLVGKGKTHLSLDIFLKVKKVLFNLW